ncbi:preprotein translocase subunit TatC [Tsukamurella tyrosinosolvens]|uniref:Sec-independent protein translocase protein TatC n=1 Tax=Tsukamurella tyrosinosolvens TaxID=57704 RepID=A0A1H4TKW2_TSUTY|nr:twin-arginine translocase subunit TatC [Tsukamurella tyrosinosolvens]KXO93163.1 preprotein translocase subunit TatC [Tsukamurella tyrosinosolvens]SEC57143.1 sec-independent protein translocase protein TatC [Tsukamurella tyrosinosolvens]
MKIPFDPRRRRAVVNPDGTMSIVEHLYELRTRLLWSLLAIVLTSIVGFWWYSHGPFGLPSTGHLLTGPYCDLPPTSRASITRDGECRLLATGVFDQFNLRLKVAVATGVLLACPVWLYQIWAFIVPALHRNEKRYTAAFVALGGTLFVSGAVLGYLMITSAFNFFLSVGNETQVTALQGPDYFSFVLNVMAIFGISFELPLFIIALNLVGVLKYAKLKQWRRGLLLSMFVFAAFLTPTGDPFTMLTLGAALAVLLELSIQFARWNDRRKAKRSVGADAWTGELDDETASPAPSSPQPIGASAGPSGSTLAAPAPLDEPEKITRASIPRSGFDDVL